MTTIDTADIDAEYMNSRFDKYLKLLNRKDSNAEDVQQAEVELHKTFAILSQEEQKWANIFLRDIQRGDVYPEEGKTLRDYITEYISQAKDDQIHRVALQFGLDEGQLRTLMSLKVTEANINEFGRFEALKATIDKPTAKAYFENVEEKKIADWKILQKVDKRLRKFIIDGELDEEKPDTNA